MVRYSLRRTNWYRASDDAARIAEKRIRRHAQDFVELVEQVRLDDITRSLDSETYETRTRVHRQCFRDTI